MGIPVAGIPRLPGAGSSARGQSGPKARPKVVADGQRVNIPALAWRVRRAASEKGSDEGQRLSLVRTGTSGPSRGFARGKAMRPCFPEKRRPTETPAVPKPTQVGGYKDTKARERNLVKELGNIAP